MKNALIYLLLFVAIQLCASFGVQGLWRVFTGSPDLTVMSLMTSTLVCSAVTVAVFLLMRWSRVSRDYVRSRPWGVLFWCAMAALGAIIPSTWLQEMMPELPNWAEGQFDMILRDRWGYVVVGLLAPVVEEIVFRGAVLRSMLGWSSRKGLSPWVAISLSAVAFALVHANPVQMPHAFLVGLLLGWMYWRTGSIVPCVAYHWVNNSVAYVLYNVLPNPDVTLPDIFGDERRVLLALVFSLCILLPALYQLSVRFRK